MAEIEIVEIDLDTLGLDEVALARLKNCLPAEPVNWTDVLTEEVIAGAMVAANLMRVH